MMTNPNDETRSSQIEAYALKAATTDPGAGYRILSAEEIIVGGDEFFTPDNEWRETINPGLTAAGGSLNMVYRRRIQCEPEYRFLELGEKIKQGDEYRFRNLWFPARGFIGASIDPVDAGDWRRKVETPQLPVIDPGTGYQLLRSGDIIAEGDQFWNTPFKFWMNAGNIGGTVSGLMTYRRKIETRSLPEGAGEGWRLLDYDEHPSEGDEIWSFRERCWKWTDHRLRQTDMIYRHKVASLTPAREYRFLPGWEPILAGDEQMIVPLGEWTSVSRGSIHRTPDFVNAWLPVNSPRRLFRRPVLATVRVDMHGFANRLRNCAATHNTNEAKAKFENRPVEIPPPDMEPGYRKLEPTERVDIDDEWWDIHLGIWKPVLYSIAGACAGNMVAVRRKVDVADPGVGYRPLGPDEILQEGDEFWIIRLGAWSPTEEAGYRVGTRLRYRRKVDVAALQKERDTFGSVLDYLKEVCDIALRSKRTQPEYYRTKLGYIRDQINEVLK